jgi:hypothetical protein
MALVSYKHNFVFIKTHKTASTSAEMFLEPFCAPPGHMVTMTSPPRESEYGIIGCRNVPFDTPPYWEGHAGARKIRDGLDPEVWARCLKVSTTRNPFTRAVSKFFYRLTLGLLPTPRSATETVAAFRAFLGSDQYKSDYFRVHIKHDYVIDRMIRYEHLRADLEQLATDLDLPLDRTSLPHARNNQKARADMTLDQLFDANSAERVREVDRWIFDHCDYSSDVKEAVL